MGELAIRVLVGRDEDGELIVAGAMDMTLWEVIPEDEEDRLWREMKERWAPDFVRYDWRQVIVKLDREKVASLLADPVLEGEPEHPHIPEQGDTGS